MLKTVALLLLLAISPLAHAGIIHVPSDAPTIQQGINAAATGDTVLVAPGAYDENINFNGKTIVVRSASGPEVTFIQPQYPGAHTVTAHSSEDVGTELSGFTIRNGGRATTVSLNCQYFSIKENIFCNNIPEIENPLTVIRAQTPCEIFYNTFYDNSGINCIFSSSDVRIINNTFDNNDRAIYSTDPRTVVLNNIITHVPGYRIQGEYALADYNNIWPLPPGTPLTENSISADPEYLDSALNNFRLQSSSPCIDTGHPGMEYMDPDGSRNDLGAWPRVTTAQYPQVTSLQLTGEHTGHVVNHTPEIQWTFYGLGTTQTSYIVQLDDDYDWTDLNLWSTGIVAGDTQAVTYDGPPLVDGSEYFLRVRVADTTGWSDHAYLGFRMNTPPTASTPYYPVDSAIANRGYLHLTSYCDATDPDGDGLYHLYVIYDDAALTVPVDTIGPVPFDSGFTTSPPSDSLVGGKYYYWTVETTDLYESSTPSPGQPVLIPATPAALTVPGMYPSIQSAIDNAGDSDTVLVAPGTYRTFLDYKRKDVLLKSEDGRGSTIIEAAGRWNPIIVMGQERWDRGTLDGFTVRGAYNDPAIITFSGTIRNCDICDNYTSRSTAGLEMNEEDALVENCRFYRNVAEERVAALTVSEGTVRNCEFFDNEAPVGAAFRMTHGLAEYNLIHHNIGTDSLSGAVYLDRDARFINNTVTHNTVGIYGRSLNEAKIYGNIIAFNDLAGIFSEYRLPFIHYCLLWQNGEFQYDLYNYNGIYANPQFADTAARDYSLKVYSPCIDAGGPDTLGTDPDGTRRDIGAIPYLRTHPTPAYVNLGDENPHSVLDNDPTIYWTYLDSTGQTQFAYEIDIGTSPLAPFDIYSSGLIYAADTSFTRPPTEPLLTDGETYYYRIRVANGSGFGSWYYGQFTLNSPPMVPTMLYPLPDSTVSERGFILMVESDDAEAGDTVTYEFELFADTLADSPLVAHYQDNSYSVYDHPFWRVNGYILEPNQRYWWRTQAFDMHQRSGWSEFAPLYVRDTNIVFRVPQDHATIQEALMYASHDDTILVAPGTYTGQGNRDLSYYWRKIHIVSQSGPDETIFDLEGSLEEPHRALKTGNYREGGLIEGFTFTNGYAFEGGVIYGHRAAFDIRNCVFYRNRAYNGGVAHLIGSLNARNCRFVENEAINAGGVFSSNTPGEILQCEFVGNQAAAAGVGDGCSGTFTACIFAGNSASAASCLKDGSPVLEFCLLYGNQSDYVYRGWQLDLLNCTIANNDAGILLGYGYVMPSFARIKNTIIANNDGRAAGCNNLTWPDDYLNPYIEDSYCNVYGNLYDFASCEGFTIDGEGNISADPLFRDPANGDYHLLPGSPCLGTGENGANMGAYGTEGEPTDIDDTEEPLPYTFSLAQNYPNPFNPTTVFSYSIPTKSHVQLEIFNILGQRVTTLVDKEQSAGAYEFSWNGTDASNRQLASGVYLYRLTTDDHTATRKLVLLK